MSTIVAFAHLPLSPVRLPLQLSVMYKMFRSLGFGSPVYLYCFNCDGNDFGSFAYSFALFPMSKSGFLLMPMIVMAIRHNVLCTWTFLQIRTHRDKPLSIYIFSENEKDCKAIIENTSCGGICINDTMAHVAGIIIFRTVFQAFWSCMCVCVCTILHFTTMFQLT